MPVSYEIDEKAQLIRTRCTGYVTFPEVMGHFQDLQGNPGLPNRLNVLLDLTEMTSVPEVGQLAAIAEQMRSVAPAITWGCFAVVASDELLFGLSRMLNAYSQPSVVKSMIFRDVAEAERWLESQIG